MADPDGWKTVDAAPWAEIVLNDPVTTLFEECIDLSRFREVWTAETHTAETVWPSTAPDADWRRWAGAVGAGFDNRLRLLVGIDPLPRSIPEPPPWHRSHICGLPTGGPHGVFSCTGATDPALLADLDKLTELAVDVLLSPFANVPLDRRHARVYTLDVVETGYLTGQFLLHTPDLILGDTVIAMKAQKKPSCLEVGRQLADLVLQDRYDRYKVANAAAYLARQARLVELPVLELFSDTNSLADLEVLRERYREARGRREQSWLVDRVGLEPAQAVVEFFAVVSGQVDLTIDREGPPGTRLTGSSDSVRTARTALKSFPLVDVLDAIRGWRVAAIYKTASWAKSVTGLCDLLEPERVVELSELTRRGPAALATS